jgi:hypothetical protein
MLDDVFLMDAICHAYNFAPHNRIGEPYANGIATGVYQIYKNFSPYDRPDLMLDEETFNNDICDPDLTAEAMFAESHTDVAIYHELPLFGYFRDGGSPIWVAEKMRERCPGRIYIYGGVSPRQPDALDRAMNWSKDTKLPASRSIRKT